MIKLYGITASRAFRPRWVLEELGLDYEQVATDFRGSDLEQADFLAVNPNGRIPALVDGDLVLWESMAIDMYLAERYGAGTGLWPDSVAGRALTVQWSFWVMTEVEQHLLSVLMHKRVLPEDKRDPAKVKRAEGILQRPLRILDAALQDRDYLLGDTFSVADLNVAAVLSWARPARMRLRDDLPHLDAWLHRCLERPARRRAQRD